MDNECIVFTDKSSLYVDIAELHISEKSDKQTIKENLRRVHITIGNAKETCWAIITNLNENICNCISMNLCTS
jgi:hypothetical protein